MKLSYDFYHRPCLEVARDLVGKVLVRGDQKLRIVTGEENEPEAVLIRACVDANGPGKLTKKLGITGQLNRQSICGEELYIEDDGFNCEVTTDKRVGIAYASPEDQALPWRFKIKKPSP